MGGSRHKQVQISVSSHEVAFISFELKEWITHEEGGSSVTNIQELSISTKI